MRHKLLIFLMLLLSINQTICAQTEEYNKDQIALPSKNQIPENTFGDLRRWILELYSEDPSTRAYAAYKLGAIGPKAKAATLFLIAILPDDRMLTWRRSDLAPYKPTSPGEEAIIALGKIGDSRAVPKLRELALSEYKGVVSDETVIALGKIHDKNAVEALISVINSIGWHGGGGIGKAAEMIGNIGEQRALKPLIHALIFMMDSVRFHRDRFDRYNEIPIINALVKLNASEALETFRKIVSSDRSDFLRNAAQKGIDDIVKHAQSVTLPSRNKLSYYNLGNVKIYLGRYPEAIGDFEHAIGLDPKYCDGYNCRGYAYFQLGNSKENYKKAIADYDMSIQLGGNSYEPVFKYRDDAVSAMNKAGDP